MAREEDTTWLLARWHRPRAMLRTDADARRYLERQVRVAVVALAYAHGVLLTVLAFVIADATENGVRAGGVFTLAAVGALVTYGWQVTLRRWRRYVAAHR